LGERHPVSGVSGISYIGAEEIVRIWLYFKGFTIEGTSFREELIRAIHGLD